MQIKAPVSWCENSFYLSERPIFTKDPLFHAGTYYPQEAGSMFLKKILNQLVLPNEPIILDLCAAPGGKSTLIASFLDEKGLLICNEVIQSRSRILAENMIKWGYTNTVVTNNDPADFKKLPNFFDVIVVDAPCSGEGMFRKDLISREEWSENNIDLCAGRQKRIVMDVWDSLNDDGYLIYSTCTFNEEENEKNIQWILQQTNAEIVSINFEPLKKDRKNFGAYALPSEVESEGFYIAVIQKRIAQKIKQKNKLHSKNLHVIKFHKYLDEKINFEKIELINWKDFYFAVPIKFVELIKLIHSELKIVKLGTEIGTMLHEKWNFHHALAMNLSLLKKISTIELNFQQSILYLKGETFSLSSEKGFKLVTYENIPLGWVNHLGNRFNNLYPKDWRIRMKL